MARLLQSADESVETHRKAREEEERRTRVARVQGVDRADPIAVSNFNSPTGS